MTPGVSRKFHAPEVIGLKRRNAPIIPTSVFNVGRQGRRTGMVDVNRFRGQALASAYLAVWLNLMTPLPFPWVAKFHLTML